MTTVDLSPEALRVAVADLGFELVDVRIAGSASRRIVAVPDELHVNLELGGAPVTLALEAIKEATLVVDWSTAGNREAGES